MKHYFSRKNRIFICTYQKNIVFLHSLLIKNTHFVTMAQKTDNVFLTNLIEDLPSKQNYRLGDTTSLIYCKAGSIQIELEKRSVKLETYDLMICMPRTLIRSLRASHDLKFYMLRVKSQIFDDIFLECFRLEPRWWEKQSFVHTNPVMRMGKYQQQLVESYYQFLSTNLISSMTVYRRHILQALARAAVLEVLNYMEDVLGAQKDSRQEAVGQSDFIFRRFIELLQEYKQEREVQFFAEKIGLTPKYLSEICKQRSGKSASEWIAEVTMAEINRMLTTSNMSIKEIAFRLNFPNSSFFCQYVKKHSGMSPSQLRRSL